MPEEARLYAAARGGTNDGVQRYVEATTNRELLISQGLPPYVEMTRQGNGWQVMDTSATAAVVVRPSTVAGLTLYNGNAAGGASYVMDRAFAFNLVTTDAVHAFSIWGCLHPAGFTAPTADITAIKGMSGNTYAGNAVVDTGATVTDDGWFPLVGSPIGNPGGVTPGTVAVAEIAGRIIIPPTGGFSINVVASLVGDTFTHGFSWYETQLSLE